MSADPVLSVGAYVLGVVWIVVSVGSLVTGAVALRRSLLPGCTPLAGGIAIAVTSLAAALVVAEGLGALQALRWGPVLGANVAVGGCMVVVARRWRDRWPAPRPLPLQSSPAPMRAAAALAAAAVGAQWTTHVADALARGMSHPDTLWYHGPYAASFLQRGSLGDLGGLGVDQTRYYPLSSELLHTIVAMPFERDVLSPLVNLGFGALALAAAALLGARFGAGALAVVAAAVVLGLPTLAGTQPGQGSSDVMAAALLLAAVALLVATTHDPAPLAVAGMALGLAVATKLSIIAPGGALAALVLVVCARARRWSSLVAWTLGIVIVAGAWPVRNAILVGHPLPYFDVHLGPLHLEAATPPQGAPSLLASLPRFDEWRGWYSGGLTAGFGRLWPVVLAAAAVGVLAAGRRGPGVVRIAAAATTVGVLAYPLTPYTGEASFQFNLRILAPTLLVACVLLAVGIAAWPVAQRAVAAGLLALLAINLTAPHHERVEAWPGHPLVAATAVAVVALVAVVARRMPSGGGGIARCALAAAGSVALGGYWLQAWHLEHRYVDSGLPDEALIEALRTTSGASVDVLGTPEVYPYFGTDLSNEVRDHSDRLNTTLPGRLIDGDLCRRWRGLLTPGDRFIVLSGFGFLLRPFSAEERKAIFTSDPAVTVVLDRGDGDGAIYQVDGDLDPSRCRPDG